MPRSEKFLIAILGIAGVIACIISVLLRPEHYPSDDAFFYLQVARNIVSGYGSTFNQITLTNGFHPLWQYCCTGIFFLSAGNKDIALLLVCITQQLFFIGIIYYLYRLNEFLKLRYWYLCIPVLTLYFLCTGLYGSEAHINGLVLLMLTYYFSKEILSPSYSSKSWFSIGILSGLLFLARLDSVFVIGAFAVIAWWKLSRGKDRRYIRCLLEATLPFALLAIPYILYNCFSFGHLVPISGAIKSTFPHVAANIHAVMGVGEIAILAALVGLIFGVFSKENIGRKFIYCTLSCGVLLLCLYLFLFTDGNTRWAWYYVAGILLLSMLLAQLFELLMTWIIPNRKQFKSVLAISLFTLLMVCAGFRSWGKYLNGDSQNLNPFNLHGKTDRKWQIEIAFWLKRNLPSHTNIFIYDWPGMIAYYSDMNILPSDGLISDYDYNDRLQKEGIGAYLKEKNVQYWLGQTTEHPDESIAYVNKLNSDGSQQVDIYSPLYRTFAGSFRLLNKNLVVDFRKAIRNPIMPDLALWKLDPE